MNCLQLNQVTKGIGYTEVEGCSTNGLKRFEGTKSREHVTCGEAVNKTKNKGKDDADYCS